VLALAALAGPALAQSAGMSAESTGLPIFGVAPPVVQPGVDEKTVVLAVSGDYDSNVAGSDAALAKERGITLQDFYAEPVGTFTFSRPIGLDTIFAQGSVGYTAYARNSILDRSIIQFNGGGLGQVGICQLSLGGTFMRRQADLAELSVVTSSGALLRNVSDLMEDSVVSASATCGHEIGIAPTASVSETWVHNDATDLATVNAQVLSTSAGLSYRSPVLGVISLLGQYGETDYPDRPVLTPTGIVSYSFQTVGGGFTYARNLGTRLQATASLSYIRLEPVQGTTQGYSGPTYSVGATYSVTPRLSANLQVAKSTLPSSQANASFEIVDFYELEASYQLGGRAIVSAGVSRRHDDYGGIILPQFAGLTEDTADRVFTSGSLKVGRRLTLTANLAFERRDANFPGLSYPVVVVGLGAASAF
jgi:hypothetical protein